MKLDAPGAPRGEAGKGGDNSYRPAGRNERHSVPRGGAQPAQGAMAAAFAKLQKR
jgi:uncharacterized protein